jgi:hypothetical protein
VGGGLSGVGLGYLVRIKPAVTVSCSRYPGVLSRYPLHKGIAHVLHEVEFRKDARVTHHMVIRWRPDLPKKRDAASSPSARPCSTGSTTCQINSYAESDGTPSRPRSSGDDLAPSAEASPSRDDRLTLVSRLRSTVLDATGAVKARVMIVVRLQRGVATGPLNRP